MDPESTRRQHRPLRPKQVLFAHQYVNPNGAAGNARLAAEMAGYAGGAAQLAVQGCRLLRHPGVATLIHEALQAHGCTLDRAAQAVAAALIATKRRSFLSQDGGVVYSDNEPDHGTRLRAAKLTFNLELQVEEIAAGVDQPEPAAVVVSSAAAEATAPAADSADEDTEPADEALFAETEQIDAELNELDSELDEDEAEHDNS